MHISCLPLLRARAAVYIRSDFSLSITVPTLPNKITQTISPEGENNLRKLLTLRFIGTNYKGWQAQSGGPQTVQTAMNAALFAIFNQQINITGCSRTDSGVHALKYFAHINVPVEIENKRLILALNAHLPKDISVLNCIDVSDDFHARYSVKSKTYLYKFDIGQVADVFLKDRAFWVKGEVNLTKMQQAAQLFVGEHNFASCCKLKSCPDDSVRKVHNAAVCKCENIIEFRISANGFLHNMVRIIGGIVLDCGLGKLTVDEVREFLRSCKHKNIAQTLPAHGLYLENADF